MRFTRIGGVNVIKEKLKRLVDGFDKLDPDSRHRLKRIFLAIVSAVVIFNFIVTIFLVMEVTSLRKKTVEALSSADDVMEALALKQILSEPGWIDPTSKDVQYIGFGLFVFDMDARVSEGKITVSGIIVNGTSVDHHDARFTLFVEKGVEADFKIASIRSGSGAPFAVKIDAGKETDNTTAPERARLIYRGSVINKARG